ncbi:MAG: T9SS type A sorting domain-containing protein, partial [Bacteroidota bacterium]
GRDDFVFHGGYPFRNLVEGNAVEHIYFDDWQCDNGPWNIVFRNHVYEKNIQEGFFPISTATDIAVVANVSEKCIRLVGLTHESWDNVQNGWACNGSHGPDANNDPNGTSVLYNALPDFMLLPSDFPTFGPDADASARLPAEQRFNFYTIKTVGENCEECVTGTTPAPLQVSETTIPCQSNENGATIEGTVLLTVTGGTPPYATVWSGNFTQTTTFWAKFVAPTFWTADVTDANGNMVSISNITGDCDEFLKKETEPAPEAPSYFEASVYPNPFSGHATLRLQMPEAGNVRLTLFSADGRQVHSIPAYHALHAGQNEIRIPMEGKAHGIYFLKVMHGTQTQVIRLSNQ